MSTTVYQLPVDDSRTSVVELADGGRRYRKQLVKFGAWVDPHNTKNRMTLDKSWAEKVVANFKSGVLNRIPVVEGHPTTDVELLNRTRGDLRSLSVEDDGVYGELDIKVPDTAKNIDDDLFYDVSVSFDPNYLDKLSGEQVGPALLHVGLVNNPYLKGMAPFQALSDNANVIMLSESKEHEVSTVSIKNEHDFPVTVKFEVEGKEQSVTIEPGNEAEVPEAAAEGVRTLVSEAKAPESKPDAEAEAEAEAERKAAEEKAAKDKADADAKAAEEAKANLSELERTKLELSEATKKLATQAAEKTYETLLTAGKVVPAQKERFMALSTAAGASEATISLSDGVTKTLPDLLAEFLEAGPKRVDFSEQGGAGDENGKTPWDNLSEGAREANAKMGISAEEYNKVNAPAA